jgi:glycosyltransferase involved in cell wall biosynthesis
MTNYDLILITTCCNHEYIYELIKSVREYNSKLSACLIVVNQTETIIKIGIESTPNTEVILLEHGKKVNTSVARNVGIDYVLTHGLKSKFVSFPDDDSSFDESFFIQLSLLIEAETYHNLVTDVYCTGTNKLFRKIKFNNGALLDKYNYNIVGAVNIILNYITFERVGYFDIRFGVNAKYGAGEDGDYFIRAVEYESFYYNNKLYSFHPSGESKYDKFTFQQKRERLISYGIGCIALLCKHKMYFQALVLTLRALGGVLYYFTKLKFTIALSYFEAFFVRLIYLIKFSLKGISH